MLLESVFVFYLIEIAFCGLSSRTSLENPNQNLVVEVGTNVSIECRIHFTELSTFEFIAVNNVTPAPIYLNYDITLSLRSRYRINNRTSGQYDFIVDRVDRTYAGKYSCKSFHSTVQQTAYLTVIDSVPVCEANSSLSLAVENDTISLSCIINSTGFMIPSMKWTKNNNVVESITVKSNTIDGSITTTSSIALQLQTQDNNATIECTTSFQWPNGSQENIPDYKHAWTHIATVLYGVRNIKIQPNSSNFQYGQQLMCFADGNPEPSYTWTHINTGHTRSGSVLTLDESLSATVVHTFECIAQNTVEGKRKTVSKSVSFYINARKPDADNCDFTLGLGIGIIIGLCMLGFPQAIFHFALMLRRRRKKIENSDQRNPAVPGQASGYSEVYLTEAITNTTPGTSEAAYGTLTELQELSSDEQQKVYTPLHIYANYDSDIENENSI